MLDSWRFPFGRPLEPVRASADEPRPVFVLTGLPGALRVRWTGPPPSSTEVRALPVDNEPTPLWDGVDVELRLARWKREVAFDPDLHGSVRRPATSTFTGRHLDNLVLDPLGSVRADTWITCCVDQFAMPWRSRRVFDRFDSSLDPRWEPWSIPFDRGKRRLRWHALEHHRARLLHEVDACRPELVVTLGDLAAWVFLRLLDERPAPDDWFRAWYGGPLTVSVGGRRVVWRELAALGSMRRSDGHRGLHDRWIADQASVPTMVGSAGWRSRR